MYLPELKVTCVTMLLQLKKARTKHAQNAVIARRSATRKVDKNFLFTDLEHKVGPLHWVERLHVKVPVIVVAFP